MLGLGSKAYSKFCEFGKFLDKTFKELGANRLMPLDCADELNSQEKSFQTWLLDVTTALSKQYLNEVDIKEIESPPDFVNCVVARFINSQGKENVTESSLHIFILNYIQKLNYNSFVIGTWQLLPTYTGRKCHLPELAESL